jgi:predicted nucleotidyltransferase
MNRAEILQKLNQNISFREKFAIYESDCVEAVVFGSYATGHENVNSDIDILFVSPEKSYKAGGLDFICISEAKLTLKSWLGGELANHIAAYGIWLKGKGEWKTKVFTSQTSIDRKKLKILSRLSHLWIRKIQTDFDLMSSLFEDVVLDCYRLTLLCQRIPIPPTKVVREQYLTSMGNILITLSEEKFLGILWTDFILQLFQGVDLDELDLLLKSRFSAHVAG